MSDLTTFIWPYCKPNHFQRNLFNSCASRGRNEIIYQVFGVGGIGGRHYGANRGFGWETVSLDYDGKGLYSLNTTTGVATQLGGTGVSSSTVGLAPSGDASVLYGSTWTNINEINTDGSGYSLLGSASAEGLAYDPYSGIMYGTINGSFFTINTATGVESTYLAAPGADIEGLAYGNGVIYGLAGFFGPMGYLYSYDIGQNAWTFIGDTGIDFSECGLAYDTELGILYAKGLQDSYLYGIDPGSAETWVIGDTGLAGGGGLAFIGETSAVPIPGAVWLLGSGLIGLAGLRRKRMK